MRVGPRELVLWSFLMASAHGAGLMLVPVLVGLRGDGVPSALAHATNLGHVGSQPPAASAALLPALAAAVVYQKLGVEVLRRAWINLDLLWVGALAITGGIALGPGLWPLTDPAVQNPHRRLTRRVRRAGGTPPAMGSR